LNHAEILAACRVSKEFFFENYYFIPIVGKGAELFHMRDYQKDIANSVDDNRLIIGLKARQIGWTTIGVANALHDVLFNPEHPWLFVSRTEGAAQKMLEKAVYAYYRLPGWMQNLLPKMESSTQSALVFANGSRIESVPATGSTGRGDAVYGALLDECAFMEYAEEIWGAVEPLVYGPAMLFSTANGMGNFFHEVWLDSEQPDSVWKGIFFPWDVVKTRDKDWYDHARASFRGREWLFFQEYPSTPEEAFAKSGRVAFPADILDDCFYEIEPYERWKWTIGGEPALMEDHEAADIEVTIWKPPTVIRDEDGRPRWKPNYVVGADVAEGLEHGDFSYVTVFDANTGEQMASCKSGIPVSYLDEVILWLAEKYLKALIIVERNNAGVLPLDRLYRDHWYPRLYRMDTFARFRNSDRTPQYGWRTDRATKPKMVNDFVFALSEGAVLLHDPEFVLEARTFVADGRGSYSATSGNHDDVIMGTLVAYQGALDSKGYPILWRDETVLPPTHGEMDAIWFAKKEDTDADRLQKPLGQAEALEKAVKTVTFTRANVGK
jgi:hypothetical protein